MTDQTFEVRFWGVRGSIAAPGPDTARYGGNTSCVEMRCGPYLLIFDAGTGIRALGQSLAPDAPVDIDLFFTHTHLDHISGLPFFVPAFDPRNAITFWSGHLQPESSLHEVLKAAMAAPLFPVPLEIFRAHKTYRDFPCGETLQPRPGVIVRTGPLDHPNRATGYRVEWNGKSVCYITDTNHVPGHPNQDIITLIRNADIVIYDSMFTEAEFGPCATWGHSTWEEGARLCDLAGARQLVLFHHDPSRTDDQMAVIEAAAAAARPGTVAAREGLVLTP